jgi:hypothetical protein
MALRLEHLLRLVRRLGPGARVRVLP